MTKQEAIGASQTANVKSVMTVRATAKNGPGVKRKLYIGLMKFLMGLSITITCGLVLFMIGYVLYRGVPNISWKLVSTSPSYLDDNIGILPDILNTQSYREGAFGLGAGKWRVIRTVVLPGCIDGVVTGCILSVGRIIGESAALLFTAGLAHAVNGMIDGLHSAGATLTVALYMYAKEQGEFGVAFAIAAILMVLTVFINLTATLLGKYFQRRKNQ